MILFISKVSENPKCVLNRLFSQVSGSHESAAEELTIRTFIN